MLCKFNYICEKVTFAHVQLNGDDARVELKCAILVMSYGVQRCRFWQIFKSCGPLWPSLHSDHPNDVFWKKEPLRIRRRTNLEWFCKGFVRSMHKWYLLHIFNITHHPWSHLVTEKKETWNSLIHTQHTTTSI